MPETANAERPSVHTIAERSQLSKVHGKESAVAAIGMGGRVLFLCIVAISSAAASAGCPGSFYASSQLAAGAAMYTRVCASCHGAALAGGAAMALVGNAFDSRWRLAGRSAGDLYYLVSTQMPAGEPGKLSTSEYLDVVAFVLHSNGYPGAADLQVRSPQDLDRMDLGACR